VLELQLAVAYRAQSGTDWTRRRRAGICHVKNEILLSIQEGVKNNEIFVRVARGKKKMS
jgi:hypothetical protein